VFGLGLVFVAILVPLLFLALERWVHLIWQRNREERRIGQTIAYFHTPASEGTSPHDANPSMQTADLVGSKVVFDGLAPCPPNGDLVVYDVMPYERTERNVSNLFPVFDPPFLKPVIAQLPGSRAMNAAAVTVMPAPKDMPPRAPQTSAGRDPAGSRPGGRQCRRSRPPRRQAHRLPV